MLKRIINWFLGLFRKSETPHLDEAIEDKKERLKKLDKDLKKEYDSVDASMSEWEK